MQNTRTTVGWAEAPFPFWNEPDLIAAREIQRGFMPGRPFDNGYLTAFGASESCEAVGGDYFDVVETEDGGAAFVVADAAGKGLGAALLSSLIQGGMTGLASSSDSGRLVAQLNRYVCARSEPHRYATAVVGVIEPDGTLRCVNAGHHPTLLVRNGHVREVMHSECFPIGMFPDAEFTTRSLRLRAGDTLALFSDGVIEARNARRRRDRGPERPR